MDKEIKNIFKIEIIICSLIFISFAVFDFYPKLIEMLQFHEKIKFARLTVRNFSESEKARIKQGLEEKVALFESGMETMTELTASVKDKIAQKKNMPLVTLMIEEQATSSGIGINSIKPLIAQQKDNFEYMPISLEFECKYSELIDFLSKLENSSTLVTVQSLSIKDNALIYPKLSVTLTLSVLFSPEAPNDAGDNPKS